MPFPFIALTDLVSTQSADEINATLVAILVSLGIPADQWRKAGSLSSILRALATNISVRTYQRSLNVASSFLDLATGQWLQARAKYDFNVDVIGASYAAGTINFVNGGAGIYGPFAPGAVLMKFPGATAALDQYYRNTATFSLNPGDNIDVNFQAVVIGSASTAAPGEINVLVSPAMTGVTYANGVAFIGSDQEEDPDLVTRTKESLGVLSPNGPSDANNYVAKTPTYSATSQPITRTNVVPDKNTGYVTTYLANAGGVPNSGDVAIVLAAIEAWATPNCRTNFVLAANPVVVPITYKVWIKNTALTVAQAEAAIANQFVEFFSQIPIGGVVIPPSTTGMLFEDTLKGQIFEATPGVSKVEIDSPSGDLTFTPDQLPQLGAITATVTII